MVCVCNEKFEFVVASRATRASTVEKLLKKRYDSERERETSVIRDRIREYVRLCNDKTIDQLPAV